MRSNISLLGCIKIQSRSIYCTVLAMCLICSTSYPYISLT